jgi:tRNA wybutosine-synthesizing protein 1
MKPVKKWVAQADISEVALEKWKAKRIYQQGYRFAGKHSAIKVCEWAKKSIRGQDSCYKSKFYKINSHQCVQMSPAAFFCDFNCLHCWRSLSFSLPKKDFKWDSPEKIIKNCIDEHKKVIAGFKGNGKISQSKFAEASTPKHFAVSLSGEPCLYPYLPELIDNIKSKGMTAFLVTNGAHPGMIKKLIGKHEPANLYVTLHAPNKEIYKKECCPIIKNGWGKISETLSLLKNFDCNTIIRLTLSKHSNMVLPELYAKMIEKASPKFIEVKAYMPVGGARAKMGYKAMPLHEEIKKFAKEIENNSSYKVINEKEESRVVLMSKS